MLSKIDAIKELQELDHALLTPEAVKKIGEPFGFYFVRKYKDERSQPKGLYLGENHKEGDEVEGLDAAVMAEMLCDKEGVSYREMYGRGSKLRECCRAMLEHLGA